MNLRFFRSLAPALLCATSLVAACGDDPGGEVPGAPVAMDAGGDGGRSGGDGGRSGDVRADEEDAGVCSTLRHEAADVTLVLEPSSPPVASGGTIADGVYVLTSGKVFTGVGGEAGEGDQRGMTLRVNGDVLEGARIEGSWRSTFTTSDASLRVVDVCPEERLNELRYSATSTSLTLQYDDEDGVFLFSFEKVR